MIKTLKIIAKIFQITSRGFFFIGGLVEDLEHRCYETILYRRLK